MTTLEQFMNGYKAHKGQCNLEIQPQLREHLEALGTNLTDVHNTLPGRFNNKITYFDDLKLAITNTTVTILPIHFYIEDDTATPIDNRIAIIDGALFIFTMEVCTQFYFFFKHYFNNLPDSIKNEYMMTLYQIEPLLKAYKSNLEWCISHSSFNPKLSTFKIFNNDDNDLTYGNSTNHCLDTRVNM